MSNVMSGIGAAVSQTPSSTAYIQPWCLSAGKRVFDVLVAAFILICTSPILLVIAAVVRMTSAGPILFRQPRVGQYGRTFLLMKFRSMTHCQTPNEPNLTAKGDTRVTAVGRLLRRYKFDELPQMINVLRGEMSLVGPRPDMQEFVSTLSPELRTFLLLKPGVTSVATLRFRNEEEQLANVPREELVEYYVRTILSTKVSIDLQYAAKASFLGDVRIIVKTISAVLH